MIHSVIVILSLFILTIPHNVKAEPTVDEMEARSEASQKLDKSYELTAAKIFMGEAGFMSTCAPKNSPLPKSFDIYFEVLPDGTLGESLFTPLTETAKCVRENTVLKKPVFPKPQANYVVKIKMKFK